MRSVDELTGDSPPAGTPFHVPPGGALDDEEAGPGSGWDPAIRAILDRAAALEPAELVRLAVGVRTAGHPAHTIEVAVTRSGRSAAAMALTAEVAVAVHRAARAARAERALRSLGILIDAGTAAADAALALLVADRLSANVAARLSAPWTSVVEARPCCS